MKGAFLAVELKKYASSQPTHVKIRGHSPLIDVKPSLPRSAREHHAGLKRQRH